MCISCAGWQSSKDWKDGDETYKGMVEVSRALMQVSISPAIISQGIVSLSPKRLALIKRAGII